MVNDLLITLGLIIITATLFAIIARIFKQPFIFAYILTGIVMGPILGIITNTEVIKTLSEIGIAFLLFIVGLEIDFKRLKNVAVVSSLGATIQILILFSFGFVVSMILAFQFIEAVYIGVILAFSSTMLVVKLLSDKGELDTLHGRIVVGFLLVEDFFAILALSIFSNQVITLLPVLLSLVKFLFILALSYFLARYILSPLFKFAAKTQELFFLCSLMVLFFFALLSHFLSLSIIIGSFIAGVALGNLPYNIEIIGKVKSLKDFFSTIFFVSLGLEVVLSSIKIILVPLVIFIGFIVFFKPMITTFLCSFFGYKKKPSFLSGMSLVETGEFSLILVAQGLLLGHISQEVFSIAVLLATTTMVVASYSIHYDHQIYRKFENALSIFDMFSKQTEELEYKPETNPDVVLFGYNRIGYSIYNTLKDMKKKLLVVDYNPELIKDLKKEKVPCIYGDAGDIEIIERAGIEKADMIISTIPDTQNNELIIKKAKEINEDITIFVTALQVEEALKLYDLGADYVILPHLLGGEHVSLLIEEFTGDMKRVIKNKLEHIEELKKRHHSHI